MLESEPELVCVGIALDVQLVAQVFNADDVVKRRLVGFAEPQNGKRVHGEPVAAAERQDLNSDVWQLGGILWGSNTRSWR